MLNGGDEDEGAHIDAQGELWAGAPPWRWSQHILAVQKNKISSYIQFIRSEGLLPHYVQIDFDKRTAMTEVGLVFDYDRDESYTPCDIVLLAGDHASQLIEYKHWHRLEPSGWTGISLVQENGQALEVHSLRLLIRANCNNGKDSRLRGLRIK